MRVYTTAPMEDPRDARRIFPRLEEIGYDGAFSFEAANVRHEHEVDLWETVGLPDGKILAPGCVTHSTVLVEHPELVSRRIQRFAGLVGRENVIASTDCGLGLRCHPQIAWAKLQALGEGARRASRALWRK